MKNNILTQLLVLLMLLIMSWSCGNEFLELKPNQRERVPNLLEDYLAIMNNTAILNQASVNALGYFGSDEFYMSENQFVNFPVGVAYDYMKNAYLWNNIVYTGGETGAIDWHIGYRNIHWSNVVLEGLATLDRSEDPKLYDTIKGMALFNRAINYYNLSQLYCPVYDASESNESLGLPIRLDSDPTYSVPRSSLEETYEQILKDLQQAVELVPLNDPNQYSVDQIAIYALFSRIYLNMEDYENAEQYADLALSIDGNLWDFNGIEFNETYSFPLYGDGNPEVIFMSSLVHFPQFATTMMYIDSNLMRLYEIGDLRKDVFYKEESTGEYTFRGSYHGDHHYFTGFTVGELFLISSESKVRLGKISQGLVKLNELRIHRYNPDFFVLLESNSENEILDWIINERRKELVLRGQRWSDLRRLNRYTRHATTLRRVVLGKEYQLPPNDIRWTWPLPPEAVQIGKLEQNPR